MCYFPLICLFADSLIVFCFLPWLSSVNSCFLVLRGNSWGLSLSCVTKTGFAFVFARCLRTLSLQIHFKLNSWLGIRGCTGKINLISNPPMDQFIFTNSQNNCFLILSFRVKFKIDKISTITFLVVRMIFHFCILLLLTLPAFFRVWAPSGCRQSQSECGAFRPLSSSNFHTTLSWFLTTESFFFCYCPDIILCLFVLFYPLSYCCHLTFCFVLFHYFIVCCPGKIFQYI